MSGVQQTARALGGPSQQGATAKIQQVGQGVQEVMKMFAAIPGVDRQKLEQANALFHQAAQLVISSVPRG